MMSNSHTDFEERVQVLLLSTNSGTGLRASLQCSSCLDTRTFLRPNRQVSTLNGPDILASPALPTTAPLALAVVPYPVFLLSHSSLTPSIHQALGAEF